MLLCGHACSYQHAANSATIVNNGGDVCVSLLDHRQASCLEAVEGRDLVALSSGGGDGGGREH